MTPGVLVIDKPPGPTSHDMVDFVRRHAPDARVGHTGTLDPFASGVLPVCIGRATRLARFLSDSRKTYCGTIVLGIATDTYDPEGRVVAERPIAGVDEPLVRRAVERFTGTILQTPPAYSARRRGGQRAHRLARSGRPVSLTPSRVTIHAFRILATALPRIDFEIECSAGTYIRSIAHDLGRDLGCGAHLGALRRLASGGFGIGEAHRPEAIERAFAAGGIGRLIVPMDQLDLGLPSVTVTPAGQDAMRHGRALTRSDLFDPAPVAAGPVRVRNEHGALIGIALAGGSGPGDPVLKPDIVLAG